MKSSTDAVLPTQAQPDADGRPAEPTAHPPASRRTLATGALVVAITCLAYLQTTSFDFLDWDDDIHVTENAWMKDLGWSTLGDIWITRYANLYIPLSYTLFAAESAVSQYVWPGDGQLDPRVFHLTSIALHALCVLMVYVLLLRLFHHLPAAAVGALVFSLHPLQVESVAWIGEQRGLLSHLLTLVALWQYVEFAERRDSPPPARWARPYVLASVAFALALLAKPSAAAAPLMALVIDLCLLGGRTRWRRSALAVAPWMIAAALVMGLTKLDQADDVMAFVPPWWARPFIAADAVAFYLGKLLVPARLAFDYGRTPRWAMASDWFYVAWLMPLALVAFLLLVSRRKATWLAGAGLFIAALAPVLGLVPFVYQDISTVADRYVYLPMFGVSVAAAGWLARHWSAAMAAVCGLVLGTWAAIGHLHAPTWRDSAAMFGHGLEINPRSYMAHYTLGMLAQYDGDASEALARFHRVLDIRPDYIFADIHLGQVYLDLREPDKAIAEFQRVLERNRRLTEAHNGLASACKMKGDTAAAERSLLAALAISRDDPLTLVNIGDLRLDEGKLDLAEAPYRRAVETRPSFAKARLKLASVLRQQAERAESQQQFDEKLAEAERHLREAIRFAHHLDAPESRALPWEQLAGLMLLSGRFDEALAAANRAVELAPASVESRFNRGCALVELGRKAEGVAEFNEALGRLPADSPVAQHIRQQLKQLGEHAP